MLIEVSKLSNLSASIASRVYPNNSLSGQLVQSGGTRDRGVNIVSVPTKSGRLATMVVKHRRTKFATGGMEDIMKPTVIADYNTYMVGWIKVTSC